jgi:hypothetical protein
MEQLNAMEGKNMAKKCTFGKVKKGKRKGQCLKAKRPKKK